MTPSNNTSELKGAITRALCLTALFILGFFIFIQVASAAFGIFLVPFFLRGL